MQGYKEYKTWLDGVNSQGVQPQVTEEQKQAQLASDMRIKGYITHAVKDDNILSKALGISLLTNGYLDDALAQVYITGKLLGR